MKIYLAQVADYLSAEQLKGFTSLKAAKAWIAEQRVKYEVDETSQFYSMIQTWDISKSKECDFGILL